MKAFPLFLLSSAVACTALSCGTMKTYTIDSKSNTTTQGTVKFTEKAGEVEMDLNVYQLKPNSIHAAHIHETGDCSAADGSSAGGHWNPTGESHGKWGASAHHAGDLGNLNTDANGTARLVMKTDKWCMGCDDESKNIIGKAIIIHAGADDFTTQPTGNAGGRVGCIEIK